ncbi:hypothetical protein AAEX63_11310 [Luteococcus sp. H138]|uniref:hypothetical protein n=1 Tax=unclassified Luteococcus TaxID=2639923 RepID=UPI00313DE769
MGIVVLVPAIDRESVIAARSWNILGRELARSGHAVVRFSLRGDGDSSDLPDADVLAAWQQDVRSAIDLAEALLPGVAVTLVGLRVGASLAAAIEDPRIGHRLLWEPVSGRRYLRAQQALRSITVAEPTVDDAVELAGESYTAEQAASIGRLKAPGDGANIRRETDREVAARLHACITRDARVPRGAIAEICASLPRVRPRALERWAPKAIATHPVASGAVREHRVVVGPHQLPGIFTEGSQAQGTRAVLFCAAGSEPMDGPTGLWTRTARDLALVGVSSLRVDRRGVGEVLDETQDQEPNPYRVTCAEDLAEGIGHLRSMGFDDINTMGLSSAGWSFCHAAAIEPPDRIVMINNVGWHRDESRYRNIFQQTRLERLLGSGIPTGDEVTAAPPSAWKRTLRGALKTFRDGTMARLPRPLWVLLSRMGIVMDPEPLLCLVPPGTRLTLLLGEADQPKWEGVHGPRCAARLGARGYRIEVLTCPEMDHSLLSRRGRLAMRRWATEAFGQGQSPSGG